MKTIAYALLSSALGVAMLSAGCYPYSLKAQALGREADSIRARTQPDDRLTAAQREKLLRDEDAFRADIAALASGR